MKTRIAAIAVFAFFLPILAIPAGLYLSGARVNITESLPQGLYWICEKPASKNDLVVFTPPASPAFTEAVQRRYIHKSPMRFGPSNLLKRIAAVAGDTVTVTGSGVFVNGIQLENSVPLTHDPQGRKLSPCYLNSYTLTDGEVFLFSDHHPYSFDSRYFGVQSINNVKDVVKPVLIYIP